MTKKVTIEIFDDTDGSQAEQTVPFGLEGVSYEIGLSTANAIELREALAPYVSAARRIGGRRIRVAVGQTTGDTKPTADASVEYTATHDIRTWAQENGHEVADRGRIPVSIINAYHASRKATNNGSAARKDRARSKSRTNTKKGK